MYVVYILDKNKLGSIVKTNSVVIENIDNLDINVSEKFKEKIFKDNNYNVLFIPKKIYDGLNKEIKKHIDENIVRKDIDIDDIMHKNLLFIIVEDDKYMFELYDYVKHYDKINNEKHIVGILVEHKG